MRPRRCLQIAVVVLILTAAGCGDPSSQLQQIDQSISSWAQTLRTAGELWLDGKVPAKYLRQTTEAADDSLTKLAKQLDSIDDSSGKKDTLRPRLDALERASSQIRLALAGEDREKLKHALGALNPTTHTSEGE
jgi:hypothetical protein